MPSARGNVLGDITNIVAGRGMSQSQKPLARSSTQLSSATSQARIVDDTRSDRRCLNAAQNHTSSATVLREVGGTRGSAAGEAHERERSSTSVLAIATAPPATSAVAAAAAAAAAAVAAASFTGTSVAEETAEAELVAAGDPQDVREYVSEIYNRMFNDEALYLPPPNYMDLQRDINPRMRAILIDWLVEVHAKYQLRLETLFLAVSLIDRYLARIPVMRSRLQLVGVVAMFAACKFEETRPPDVHDFVYITDHAYTKEEILVLECTMLTTLGFSIAGPTAAHFLQYLQRINGSDEVHRHVAQYVAELALVDYPMVRHRPSHLAAAAVLLSNEALGRQPAWPPAMARQSRYGEQALRRCAQELQDLARAASSTSLQAVRRTFNTAQCQYAARLIS